MDCLDRTNVVQSTFAKHVLIQQLIELDILSGKDDLDKQVDFTFMYRGGTLFKYYINLFKNNNNNLVGLAHVKMFHFICLNDI